MSNGHDGNRGDGITVPYRCVSAASAVRDTRTNTQVYRALEKNGLGHKDKSESLGDLEAMKRGGFNRCDRRRTYFHYEANAAMHDGMQFVTCNSAPVMLHAYRIYRRCLENSDPVGALREVMGAIPVPCELLTLNDLPDGILDIVLGVIAFHMLSLLDRKSAADYARMELTDEMARIEGELLALSPAVPSVDAQDVTFAPNPRDEYPPPDISPTVVLLIVAAILAPRAPQRAPEAATVRGAAVWALCS